MTTRFDLDDETACLLRHVNRLKAELRDARERGDAAAVARLEAEIVETEERL